MSQIFQNDTDILDKRFKVIKKIGQGSFGEIFQVEKRVTKEMFAMKVEKAIKDQKNVMLFWEAKIIKALKLGKMKSVPNIVFVGQERSSDGKVYHIMIMDLLGQNLQQLFDKCGKYDKLLDLESMLNIGIQIIQILKEIHSQGIIYRDVKPENFLIGNNQNDFNKIYVVDFGLAKYYMVPEDEGKKEEKKAIENKLGDKKVAKPRTKHIPMTDGKQMIGTPRYASLNTHNGLEQSRRDDLETLSYLLVYLYRGSLPWIGLDGKNRQEKYINIKYNKEMTPIEELCKGMPPEFMEFQKYSKDLQFDKTPDYNKILALFEGAKKQGGLDNSTNNFCWTEILEKERKQEMQEKEADRVQTASAKKQKNKVDEKSGLQTRKQFSRELSGNRQQRRGTIVNSTAKPDTILANSPPCDSGKDKAKQLMKIRAKTQAELPLVNQDKTSPNKKPRY